METFSTISVVRPRQLLDGFLFHGDERIIKEYRIDRLRLAAKYLSFPHSFYLFYSRAEESGLKESKKVELKRERERRELNDKFVNDKKLFTVTFAANNRCTCIS